jgi:hypothetical protein
MCRWVRACDVCMRMADVRYMGETVQTAAGHDLSVPMPGHAVALDAQTQQDAAQIEALIQAHDVIFLLMDTRESRWLPTMLCALYNKVQLALICVCLSVCVCVHVCVYVTVGEGGWQRPPR